MSPNANYPERIEQVTEAFIASNFGWWEHDIEKKHTFWSPKCRELYGLFTDREITYADWIATVHPDDFERVEQQVQIAIQSTGYYDEEFTTIGIEDRKLRRVRSIAKVLCNEEGVPVKLAGIIIETTKPEVAKPISPDGDFQLKLIADTMPQLVWTTLPDGYHDFYNRRWYEYTGLTYEQTRGKGWNDVLHPDDQERAWEIWRHSLQTGEPYEIEYRFKRYDGQYRWFLGRALPLRDENGNIVKWYGTCTDIHDQKLFAEELKQSKERFDLLAQATQDIVWDWNLATDEIWWNEGFKTILGYQDEDIEPTIESWYSRLHPEDKDRIIGGIHEAIDHGGKHCSFEYRFRKKDGTYAIVFDRAYALHDREGKPYRMLGSMQDITARKNAEKALLQSEERLQKVLTIETVGVIYFDLEGRIHDANVAFQHMSGFSKEDLVGGRVRWDELTPPEFMAVTIKSKEELLSKGQNTPYEKQYIRPDGSRWWGLFAGKRLSENEYVEFALDITERKQYETTLKESEERFSTLANSIDQLAWIAQADGWIYWYNQRWYEYTGSTLQEMEGWGWQKVHHPEHIDRVTAFVKEALRRGEPWELTFPIRRHDGVYRWFLTRVFPVKNDEGTVIQWIGTNTDIDDQKQAETLLEQRVKQRTQELEIRNKELEQFAYVSHHDLQEPLRKILTFSDMVKLDSYDRLTEPSKKRLDKVMDAARRMRMILTDVLNFASLSKEEQFIPVALDEVLANVHSDLELVMIEKSAKIYSEKLPTIKAVPGQMHQLLYNLVNNALKFSKKGQTPVINISCRVLHTAEIIALPQLERARLYYEIAVKDNGIGFHLEDSSKIFELFQRLHTKNAYEGTGIGLALCKKIVLNHGGLIRAEGKEGAGATFKIVLPAE